jgi:hypothetical protein
MYCAENKYYTNTFVLLLYLLYLCGKYSPSFEFSSVFKWNPIVKISDFQLILNTISVEIRFDFRRYKFMNGEQILKVF